jgi:riboflavin synthase
MFTGIVEELGVVEALVDQGDAVRLTVRGPHVTLDAGLATRSPSTAAA